MKVESTLRLFPSVVLASVGGCYSGTVLGGQVGDRLTWANPLTLTQPEEGRQGSGAEDSLLYNKSKEKEQEKQERVEEKEERLQVEEEEEGVSKPRNHPFSKPPRQRPDTDGHTRSCWLAHCFPRRLRRHREGCLTVPASLPRSCQGYRTPSS